MTATAEAIRDRCIALIEAIAPTLFTKDAFRRYRNEGKGDFAAWASANAAACRRRFQARDVGDDQTPPVSNLVAEERFLDLQIMVAYPQDSRAGRDNALDRDDVIVGDWKKIDFAIGVYGAGNFSGVNNCTPLGASKTVDRVGDVDFLIIKARYQYWSALGA